VSQTTYKSKRCTLKTEYRNIQNLIEK
jgi:hypothetical protein